MNILGELNFATQEDGVRAANTSREAIAESMGIKDNWYSIDYWLVDGYAGSPGHKIIAISHVRDAEPANAIMRAG